MTMTSFDRSDVSDKVEDLSKSGILTHMETYGYISASQQKVYLSLLDNGKITEEEFTGAKKLYMDRAAQKERDISDYLI